MRLRTITIALITLCSCAPKERESPESLGKEAAKAETIYFVFGKNADLRAGQFMKAWVRACELAENDMTSDAHRSFIASYVAGLQEEPGAAAGKPLQRYVTQNYWKSGLGCHTVEKETPQWAFD